MKTKLLILAAGMGSRFGGMKQTVGIGSSGETILEYSVYDAMEAGFDEVVFLIRSGIEADFREHVLSRLPSGLPIKLAFQELDSLLDDRERKAATGRTKPWGTGHALLCAEAALDAPFAVINADDFYGRASFAAVRGFLSAADPGDSLFCMAGYRLSCTTSPNGPVSRGICELEAGERRGSRIFLRGLAEHKEIQEESGRFISRRENGSGLELPGDAFVSMNFFGFTPAVFPLMRPLFDSFIAAEAASPKKEFYLSEAVGELIEAGRTRVEIIPTPESWFGLTYREDFEPARSRLRRLCSEGLYPEPLWADAGSIVMPIPCKP